MHGPFLYGIMDIKLYYQEEGQGEPLILLHGNGEDGTYFVHQIAYFRSKYRVIAVDTRGHGKSPRGTAPFTIRQFADDLYGFMDEHGIEKAHILGFSDGGNIALCFALKYPERVNSLILNGANLYSRGVKFKVQFPVEVGYRIAKFFARQNPRALANAEMLGLMVNDPALTEKDISTIAVPTLVIAGKNDMIKDSHTRLIAKSISNAELSIIEGDHFCAAGNSIDFNRDVDTFLMKN